MVSLSGTMQTAISVLLEKNAFGSNASLLACGPQHCPFSRTSNDCLSTFYDTRGSRRARNSVGLARAGELVPQKKFNGERSGEQGGGNSTVPCNTVL